MMNDGGYYSAGSGRVMFPPYHNPSYPPAYGQSRFELRNNSSSAFVPIKDTPDAYNNNYQPQADPYDPTANKMAAGGEFGGGNCEDHSHNSSEELEINELLQNIIEPHEEPVHRPASVSSGSVHTPDWLIFRVGHISIARNAVAW